MVKFSFSEKATKNWKNLPLVWRYWVKTAVLSKQVGDFFQILWPSHNVLTLTQMRSTLMSFKDNVVYSKLSLADNPFENFSGRWFQLLNGTSSMKTFCLVGHWTNSLKDVWLTNSLDAILMNMKCWPGQWSNKSLNLG